MLHICNLQLFCDNSQKSEIQNTAYCKHGTLVHTFLQNCLMKFSMINFGGIKIELKLQQRSGPLVVFSMQRFNKSIQIIADQRPSDDHDSLHISISKSKFEHTRGNIMMIAISEEHNNLQRDKFFWQQLQSFQRHRHLIYARICHLFIQFFLSPFSVGWY